MYSILVKAKSFVRELTSPQREVTSLTSVVMRVRSGDILVDRVGVGYFALIKAFPACWRRTEAICPRAKGSGYGDGRLLPWTAVEYLVNCIFGARGFARPCRVGDHDRLGLLEVDSWVFGCTGGGAAHGLRTLE